MKIFIASLTAENKSLVSSVPAILVSRDELMALSVLRRENKRIHPEDKGFIGHKVTLREVIYEQMKAISNHWSSNEIILGKKLDLIP